jgi:hypothetical protein
MASPKARKANTSSVRIDYSTDDTHEPETAHVTRGGSASDLREVKVGNIVIRIIFCQDVA